MRGVAVWFGAVVLGVGLGWSAGVAQGAQTPGTTTDGGKPERSMSDQAFVNHAIMGDHGTIDLATLALKKSSNNLVKQAAQTMVTEHTQMLDEMKQVAQTVGWRYQDGPGRVVKGMEGQLDGLSGTEFDKEFVADLIKLHQQEVQMFQAESANAKVEPVMKVAGEQLPKIREHLHSLEALQQSGL